MIRISQLAIQLNELMIQHDQLQQASNDAV
jgi:hypothetical protein